ncbi:hypothetical protein C488_14797 [Natrinema pellirubrum DSM 15624]|uniref:Uncharacterized protein n=1 Tax=Natrinema pellirubrum (strain DSM 15624 / CIP 106293 / JCM 10476 / NCIMB 786 / 157) TaxID=797303 RepID=L9YGD1_NATP1|nr:hypothetical protein C488_14797 [Natrinema pellirubrum DSM 15624]
MFVGIGLVIAAHLIGVESGRAVIKLAYATLAGLAVGEVVTPNRTSAATEAAELAKSQAIPRAVGMSIGLALVIGPYTLESILLSMRQATDWATLIGITLLFATGWRLGHDNSSRRVNAVRLVIAGIVVVILAILIPR